MENILLKYMSQRFEKSDENSLIIKPVITISREYGCYATRIAELLCNRLLEKNHEQKTSHPWKWVTKEVLEKAANELKLKPEQISHVFGAKEKGMLEDILFSFSTKQYTSDTKIKQTITNVVRSYVHEGYVIIVGRASSVIAKDHPKALHFKLHAPYEWRVNCIKDRFKITISEARDLVAQMQEKRNTFMKFFRGNLPESEIFHACFNRKTLTETDIVETILHMMELRKMI